VVVDHGDRVARLRDARRRLESTVIRGSRFAD
jgi:hypothetical protein